MVSTVDWPHQSFQQSFTELRNDYRAAKQTRFTPRLTGVSANGSGADYHYKNEYQYLHMIERSRHWERNDPVVGQGIRRLVSNVIQEGFTPDPDTGDKELDKALKELWMEWSCEPDACHSEGEFNWHQLERLTLKSVIRDGDIFALLLDNGRVQMVEAHRPRTPSNTQRNVIHGLMLDDNARRQEIWISKEDLDAWSTVRRVSDIARYPIRDEDGNRQVLQMYFPDRTSQRRGIGALVPTSDIIGMHDDIQFAALVKQQLVNLIVILRELDKDTQNPPGPPIGAGGQVPQVPQKVGGTIKQIPGLQAGLDITSTPGEKLQFANPNVPGANFFEHTQLLLTFMSINLDLPLQVFLLEPKANFSAWRGAIDQARTRFFEIQKDLAMQFHRPVWKWKVRDWMSQSSALRGMAERQGVRYLRHKWQRPAFAYIEPNKDAQADALQSDKFLASYRRIHSAKGAEWDEVCPEIIADRVQLITGAIEAARGLKKKYGEDLDISWRDVLSPDLGSVPRQAVPAVPEEDDPEDKAAAAAESKKSADRKAGKA